MHTANTINRALTLTLTLVSCIIIACCRTEKFLCALRVFQCKELRSYV